MPTANSLKGSEIDNMVHVLEGNAAAISPKVAAAADEVRPILNQVLETGRALGLEIGELADYFPHRFQYGVFKGDKRQKAIESLMKHGKADSKEQAGVILNTLENINRGRKVPKLEMAREYNNLTLLAETPEGYRNLSYLVSEAFQTGFYYKPRMDWELLEKHHEGLVALSGCVKSEVSHGSSLGTGPAHRRRL